MHFRRSSIVIASLSGIAPSVTFSSEGTVSPPVTFCLREYADLYVDQRLTYSVGEREERAPSALQSVLEWASAPQGRFVLVLGDFGTGKTFLLPELARRM